MSEAPKPVRRQAPVRTAPSPQAAAPDMRPELRALNDAGRPWWAETPDIIAKCLSLAFAPIRYAALILEIGVSLVFLTLVAVVVLWWNGKIADATVAHYLGMLGDRVLAILQSSGIL